MSRPGLYLHVPFCTRVCPYCDFAVLVGDAARRERYVESLIVEIGLWGVEDGPDLRDFDTIYFGGGTPSMLDPEQLERVLTALARGLELSPEPWIFLEANPEDVTVERLRGWRDLGVRTLSLGVQSFDAGELEDLGRLHSPAGGRHAVELALEAGFSTVSLDLIYGLPGQTEKTWRRNLDSAVELEPDHLSCYQLTVHGRTVFGAQKARGELVEMPNDAQADLFLLTHRLLKGAGLPAYEVSNFARSREHRSRHNAKYWDHTPYLGLGPSAHSFAGGRRWWNHRALGAWQASLERGELPVAEMEALTARDLARERVMLAMRTSDGIDLEEFRKSYESDGPGLDESALGRLVDQGLLKAEPARARPTLAGLAVADTIARELTR